MQSPPSLSTHSRCHAPRSDGGKNRAWVKTIGSFISCLRGPCVVSGLQSLMATWYQDDGDSNARRGRASSPVIPGWWPFPLPSRVILSWLAWSSTSPRLAWSRFSPHPLLMAGPGPPPPAWASYPSLGLAAAALSVQAHGSPLSLLTAILSCSQPLVAPLPCPPVQPILILSRRLWAVPCPQSVSVSLSISHPQLCPL